MIFYAGNDPEVVWYNNPNNPTGPKPIRSYREFFDLITISDPFIHVKCSVTDERYEDMEMLVVENIENEHFYVFCMESNSWAMKFIHRAVKAAEEDGRNHRAFYRIMEGIMANTGYHTNNNMVSLIRQTQVLSREDVFVSSGLAQKLIAACAPTPEGEDPF